MTDDDKTIFGDDDDGENPPSNQSSSLSFDEITGNKDYIGTEDLMDDGGVQYEVADIRRNENAKYTFSEAEHAIDITTKDGRTQTVNAWGLWGDIRQAYREASAEGFNSVAGLHLRVSKEGRGDYNVSWSLDGEEFNPVESE